MKAFVVDANVLIAANNRETEQATPECVQRCVLALEEVQHNVLVLDEVGFVFAEYAKYNSFAGQPGLGDAFFKWVYQNQFQLSQFERVDISQIQIPEEIIKFDPADHIWLKVARASQLDPRILNAVDSDWKIWAERLELHGFRVLLLC